jgi:hypothetical protein
MEMPKPGDAHKKLSDLVGEWHGAETLHPSPWDVGGAATGRTVNRWILDGFAIHQEYEQVRDGKVTFRGHGVIWYDASRGDYVMHWWDSMGGTVNEYRGRLEGNRLELSAPMPQGGVSRTSWLLAPDAHDFLMEISPDGSDWQPAMAGRYTKGTKRAGTKGTKKTGAKGTKRAGTKGTKRAGTKGTKAKKGGRRGQRR